MMEEMTCREFDEVVHGFVRMELLDVSLREAALEHAAHCDLCSGRMADAAALAEATEIMGQERAHRADARSRGGLADGRISESSSARSLAAPAGVGKRGSRCGGLAGFSLDG